MTDALVTTFHGDTADPPPLGDSVSASVDGGPDIVSRRWISYSYKDLPRRPIRIEIVSSTPKSS